MSENETETEPTAPTDPFADVPADEIIDTSELESLDQVHAAATHNRAAMGPEANDGTITTPGTELPVEPGPGPEENEDLEAIDNATGGAITAAMESAEAAAEAEPHPEPQDGGDDGGDDGGEEEFEEFDPGEHTVADVQQFIADNPELEEDVLAAERAGKNRSSLVG